MIEDRGLYILGSCAVAGIVLMAVFSISSMVSMYQTAQGLITMMDSFPFSR